MLPYLARFAPTRGRSSGFQTPLVFDDCGITLEVFVCSVCLLSAVLRSLGGSRGESFALLPSEWRAMKGGMGLFYPHNNLQKAPKLNHLLPSFLSLFFCFAEE